MSCLPNSTILGILNLSECQDAEELSKCQNSIRKMYIRNRRHRTYEINVKQPVLEEDNYTLTIRNSLLQFPKHYSMNMDELKKRLLRYSPTSVKFEISDLATIELLGLLPEKWFNSVTRIDIQCLETDKYSLEANESLKTKIKKFIIEFGTIDNIMFKPNEITSSGYDQMHLMCWWLSRQKMQTRGFRIKYEKLRITVVDVKEVLVTASLSKYFFLWMEVSHLSLEIEEYLETIEDANGYSMLNNNRIISIEYNPARVIISKVFVFFWLSVYLINVCCDNEKDLLSCLLVLCIAIIPMYVIIRPR